CALPICSWMAMTWPTCCANNPRNRPGGCRRGCVHLNSPRISRLFAPHTDAGAQALRVLVIQARPRTDSLCAALARAYAEGARTAGAEVEQLTLAELAFDPNMHQPSPNQQPLEPDLVRARDLIAGSDHLVFVYPTWWGTMPALLK